MDIKRIVLFFLGWRLLLYVFLVLALQIVPLQLNFLGGGLSNYLHEPYLWAWANFDGEHYISIANHGYEPLTYFYFPVFPLLVGIVAKLFNASHINYIVSGLVVSNLAFLIGLKGFLELIKLDYEEKVLWNSVILLILFPTSFFFGSFYTEGIFFAFTVWSFYFARKGKWINAGILGALATATRITGLALVPALMVEAWLSAKNNNKIDKNIIIGLTMIPFGLLIYMYYLYRATGDPINFLHTVNIFGQQRTSVFVFLPQVFYRYLFKILPNLNYNFFPVVFTTYLEFISALLFLAGVIILFIKSRLSYALYALTAYVIPTLSGSFSSLPRYVLIIFPVFILLGQIVSRLPLKIRLILYSLLMITLSIAASLFVRGYWIS